MPIAKFVRHSAVKTTEFLEFESTVLVHGMLRGYPKTTKSKGTVPFHSEDSAKSGQSPAVFG
jgi:hypothetical protein